MTRARSMVPLCLLLVVACLTTTPSGAKRGASPVEQRIAKAVDTEQHAAVALLEKLVNVNSGTLNLEGVREVGSMLRVELDALGFDTQWVDQNHVGRAGHLIARRDGDRGPEILLIGHLDTVFEPTSGFTRFVREGDIARGPGVYDMKGGDVVILYALRALKDAQQLDGARVTVVFTGDEEAPGKPLAQARKHLIDAAKRADIALGFEPGMTDGGRRVVNTARRGSVGWQLEVEGKGGHSSLIFSDAYGAGAIFEASRILTAFYDEVRGEPYLTFNAGTIAGGDVVAHDEAKAESRVYGKSNIIPRKAVIRGGLRTISQEQLDRARAKMGAVVTEHLPRTDAKITFEEGYPAMTPTDGNRGLFLRYRAVSDALALGPIDELDPGKRGAADISFAAPHCKASLAGLGPVGEGAHSVEERVDLNELAATTKRTAVLLYRLINERP